MMFKKNAGVAPVHIDVLLPDVVDAEQLSALEDRLELSGELLMRFYSVKY
ncbi:hypothetical protein [Curtobacterium sp. MCBA15_009]|nr:hypothetical protein [Curtobacterium sp. MCBA15_009]